MFFWCSQLIWTYDFLYENFNKFFKKVKNISWKILDLWNNSHWTTCWYENLLKIVEVTHTTMLKILIHMNAYL